MQKAKFNTVMSLATIDTGGSLITEIRLVEDPKSNTLLIDIRKKRSTPAGDVYTPKGIVFSVDDLRTVKEAIDNAVEALDILEVKQ